MCRDIIDDRLAAIFDYILDYQGVDEASFASELINKFKLMIGEMIDELKDGFENEM